jgi:hypothetical protein
VERRDDLAVPFNIAGELLFPECDVRVRSIGESASWVSMPEAPMDEYHRAVLRKNDVGAAGERSSVQAESETLAMKERAH